MCLHANINSNIQKYNYAPFLWGKCNVGGQFLHMYTMHARWCLPTWNAHKTLWAFLNMENVKYRLLYLGV